MRVALLRTSNEVTGRKPFRIVSVLVAAGALLTLAACSQATAEGSTSTTVAVDNPALPEEYEVYNAVLADSDFASSMEMYATGRPLVVIRTPTEVLYSSVTEEGLSQDPSATFEGMRAAWPGLADDIFADFEAKNENPGDLEPRFSLSTEYLIANLDTIFDVGASGWDDFYAEYPEADGVLTLSRVGFNESMDTALLLVTYYHGGLAGRGQYVLLTKTGGSWTIRSYYGGWIS
jgi:hypothetical protein